MTGIERLRTIAGSWDAYGLGGALGDVARQIERERACDADIIENVRLIVGGVVDEMERHILGHEGMDDSPVARWARELREALGGEGHDSAADVSMSADDLLPQEDRDAIAWVRDHGGLEEVEAHWSGRVPLTSVKRMVELHKSKRERLKAHISSLERVCAERRDKIIELRKTIAEMRPRLMPEGMEWLLDVWPKWSNGEYCKFGDWWKSEMYGEHEPNQFRKLSIYTPEQLDEWGQGDGESYGYEWDFVRPSDSKYRPDKAEPPAPKVLDADGVEIRVGDTVWTDYGDGPWTVTKITTAHAWHVYGESDELGSLDMPPSTLTHRAPVLAADGKPLREGETVWSVDSGTRYTVEKITDELIPIKCCSEMGSTVSLHPSQLTHERPVLDVDGAPIKVGDTVWYRTGAARGVVESIDANSILPLVVYRGDSGELYRDAAKDVTHTKPEIDTWERIEEDATKLSPYYYARDVMGLDTDKMPPKESRRIDMMRDLVRRARALAGRDA